MLPTVSLSVPDPIRSIQTNYKQNPSVWKPGNNFLYRSKINNNNNTKSDCGARSGLESKRAREGASDGGNMTFRPWPTIEPIKN